jgi:hypothetical protein
MLEDIRERERRTGRRSSGGYVEYIIGGKGSDTAAPINVPLPAGLMPMQGAAGASSTDTAAAQQSMPQNLADLIKLSASNKAAASASSK